MEEKKVFGIDFVICPYCSKEMKTICPSHLKKHNVKMEELRKNFPDCKLVCSNYVNKRKETFLKMYGVDNPSKAKCIKEKKIDTFQKNYRVDNCFSSNEIKEKIKETNLEKFGCENPAQNDQVKDKIKNTFIENYGGNPQSCKEIRDKGKETNLKKYGHECVFSSDEIKEKIVKSNLEKFGFDNPSKNSEIKQKKRDTFLISYTKRLENEFFPFLQIELLDGPYLSADIEYTWKCLKCGNEFKQPWYHFHYALGCKICYPRKSGTSIGEKEVLEFIRSLGFENILENDRKIIKPLELDIVIEDLKIAIEYCGLYWHSEIRTSGPKSHLEKYNRCLEKGYRLITIFDDEWFFKSDLVKIRLKHILNKSDSKRIYARKCIIKEIDYESKNNFLEKYHIQGKDISSINLGAFYNNELVSVMTFSKGNISKGSKSKDKVFELNRFCSSCIVPGIANKLLSYFEKNYKWITIFSYSDKRWNTGNIYTTLGFIESHHTGVNYWYFNNKYKRIHRFNLRKKPDEPKDIPEHILRLNEGYIRIFDCGSIKFIKVNKKFLVEDITNNKIEEERLNV